MKTNGVIKKLKNVCEFDKFPNRKNYLPYVGLEHIESNTGVFTGSLNPQNGKSLTFNFTEEHVLYGRLRPYLNKVLLPTFEGHCSSEIFPIRVKDGLDKKYLFYWLTSDETVQKINATSTGARMPRANMNTFLDFEIVLPPLPEQKRIVSILDEAFSGISRAKEIAEKNLANAREVFESYLESVFANPGEGWEEKCLGELCELITDGKHGDCENEADSGYYFLSAKDVKNNILNYSNARQITKNGFAETHRRTNLMPGDICMVNTGATIGRISIAPNDPKTFKTTFQKSVAVIKTMPKLLNNHYCCYLLKSDLKKLVKVSSGSAIHNLLLGDIKKHKVIIPTSIIEQKRIVAKLDALTAETQKLESNYRQKLASLDELKKSILQKAFSGELTGTAS